MDGDMAKQSLNFFLYITTEVKNVHLVASPQQATSYDSVVSSTAGYANSFPN
jgi:hypothetical protein